MTFELKYTQTFYEDLDRLADFLIERDPDLAERALNAIQKALMILQDFPLMARRASADDPCCANSSDHSVQPDMSFFSKW